MNLTTPHGGQSLLLYCGFALLMIAVVLRKGLLPAHSWVLSAYERGPLLPLTLLVNGHLGAFLIARVAIPLLPDIAKASLPMLGNFGLVTAAYTSLLAIVEKQPRRLLALLSISQASFILTGLESTNPDAVAGALVHWQVVTVASTMLAAVYAALEARLGAALETTGFLGLAIRAPRLAVFFLAGGLALVGLPLTLGFCAEDLLLHGTLETHPQLGIILPIVTALNAFHVLRLFARLFLGQPVTAARTIVDALPRERWALTFALLFLVVGGLLPNLLVQSPSAAAEKLISGLKLPQQTAQASHSLPQ
jgi:NADH-quinone oxidoreductase subunit M